MKGVLSSRLLLCCVAAVLATGSIAQEIEGVRVEATRVEKSEVRTPGILNDLELRASYRVTYGDLDLTTREGRTELNQRIYEAADLACREIEKVYPFARPAHDQCAREAAHAAKSQIRLVVAAR